MDQKQEEFARTLYFDMQRIDGVDSLEIWNGIMELDEPYEKTGLIKNLYKIVIPLVNEALFGRPFAEHSALVKKAVSGLLAVLGAKAAEVAEQFPDPPTQEAGRKELYRLTREEARGVVAPLAAAMRTADPARVKEARASTRKKKAPVDLAIETTFDFTELRIIDNELPYIIFTDKEYWVIHGMVVVYLWLIGLDSLFTSTLRDHGVEPGIADGYMDTMMMVHKSNPFGEEARDPAALYAHIREKMKDSDYLDVFEGVYKWFDSVRERLEPK